MIKKSIPADTRVIDICISYDEGDANVWRCMSGAVNEIQVYIKSFRMQDIEDVQEWLNKRWYDKERWLAAHKKHNAVTMQ